MRPSSVLAFVKVPDVSIETKCPWLDIAIDNKFWSLIKDGIDLILHTIDPLFESSEIIRLSWLIKNILSLKTLILDFNGIPWFLIQLSFPLSRLIE